MLDNELISVILMKPRESANVLEVRPEIRSFEKLMGYRDDSVSYCISYIDLERNPYEGKGWLRCYVASDLYERVYELEHNAAIRSPWNPFDTLKINGNILITRFTPQGKYVNITEDDYKYLLDVLLIDLDT